MKEQTKTNIKNAFASLIRNDAAMECGRTIPWYVAVIVAIIAVFLPVIPLMVSVGNTYGAQLFKNYTYDFERNTADAMLTLREQGYDFKVGDKGELLRYKDGNVAPMSYDDEFTPVFEYSLGDNIQYQLYFSDRPANGAKDVKVKYLNDKILNTQYIVGTKFIKGSDEAVDYINQKTAESSSETYKPTYYRPTYMLLYKDGLNIYIGKTGTTTKVAVQNGDWKHTLNTSLITRFVEIDGYADKLDEKDLEGRYSLLRNNVYLKEVQESINKTLNEAYKNIKERTFIMYTTIFYGVYVVLIAFMGLMIFLITRGKKNPMNYVTVKYAMNIAAWCTIAPAILAMILGFFLTNLATMFFIILYGIRVMWLSMRQLKPTY